MMTLAPTDDERMMESLRHRKHTDPSLSDVLRLVQLARDGELILTSEAPSHLLELSQRIAADYVARVRP